MKREYASPGHEALGGVSLIVFPGLLVIFRRIRFGLIVVPPGRLYNSNLSRSLPTLQLPGELAFAQIFRVRLPTTVYIGTLFP